MILLLALLGCGPGRAPATAARVPPDDYDAIYFVLVDRFANGDPTNDGDVDPSDPQAFHGGDLQGVLDHLDHIEGLGARTVWLSPVFAMRAEPFHGHGAFHGYWVEDPGRVEPRFGDEALLARLSDALRARGMRLVLDVVWNHVGYGAPLVTERPDWFHGHGTITDWADPFQLVNHEVHGLPDLAQERPDVHAWLRDHTLRWLPVADGFRVDAVRHMPLDFQRQMGVDARAIDPGFTLIGEVFDGDPVALAETWEAGGFDSVFDFPLRYALVDTFCKDRPLGRLGAVLSLDAAYPDPHRLVTFLDNHDVPRILSECGGDASRVADAIAFMTAVRGVPCLTYGTEVGLEGAAEPDNRADMRFVDHPLASATRDALARRRAHPSLVRGDTVLYALEDDVLVLLRVADGETAVVGVNRRGVDATVGDVTVPPGVSVRFADVDVPEAGTRTVRFVASGVPDGAPVIVGTGRALGGWDPAKGVALEQDDGRWTATAELPVGAVLEFKLVVGGDRWQSGENRYGFVGAGSGAQVLEVAW